MSRTAIIFGVCLALLLVLLKSIEYLFLTYRVTFEFYAGLIGAAFFIIGVWAGIIMNKKSVNLPSASMSISNDVAKEYGLSTRELDVLREIADGLSNQEIADKLFVSLNTVKTHIANIYSKLGVKRRTCLLYTSPSPRDS